MLHVAALHGEGFEVLWHKCGCGVSTEARKLWLLPRCEVLGIQKDVSTVELRRIQLVICRPSSVARTLWKF